ncbi:hypothetical protein L1047_12875 [Synechococcus sp. Nb3U1]|uniref:Npun_F0494 family protein n=1 Tax=Synechococcus sp. Nb3U1 TaxID=1914529 RepID=UPI001F3EB95C|nr:Npun_F0494 family protein [Synechococcus sp. Nb3U1]MCF2972090.1 hypothetical protein [Synechococcus sp. Nb3U1]
MLNDSVYRRARRAWACSPFRLPLLRAMSAQGIPLGKISGLSGVQVGYTQRPLPEMRADQELMWLIQVGLLRREVDGQGITDSYRLAPLGRQLLQDLEKGETHGGIPASWADHLQNLLTRWQLFL